MDDENLLRWFGMQARETRRALHLTVAQAAGRAGLQEAYLRRVENGQADVTLSEAERIARAFGLRFRPKLG